MPYGSAVLRDEHAADQQAWVPPRLGLVDANGTTRDRLRDPLASIGYVIDFSTEGRHIRFRRPLRVEISNGEEFAFCIYSPTLGMGGVGNTFEEAAGDLCESIWLLWSNLRQGTAALDESARAALERLVAILPA
ncbi:MAG TPA: hypothetical protein VFG53_08510 [Anaeromyxobacter sp.]|nr:hypothetical protein [Anaeromyxobacter sp.]